MHKFLTNDKLCQNVSVQQTFRPVSLNINPETRKFLIYVKNYEEKESNI